MGITASQFVWTEGEGKDGDDGGAASSMSEGSVPLLTQEEAPVSTLPEGEAPSTNPTTEESSTPSTTSKPRYRHNTPGEDDAEL